MLEKGDMLVIEDGNHVLWDFKVESVNPYSRTVTGVLMNNGRAIGERITVPDHQIQTVNERLT